MRGYIIRGLYAIVNLPCTDPVRLAAAYLQGGASVIQLRDKGRMKSSEAARIFRETARAIAALERSHCLFIVNDDPDLALEVGADGVHVGKGDPSIEECKKRFIGRGCRGEVTSPLQPLLVGYSAHSLEEALEAEQKGADYVAFGAIFPTKSKPVGHPVQGLERLREVVRSLRVPVVAIGGIGRDNVQEVLATGVASVAVISALAQALDHAKEADFFSRLFRKEAVGIGRGGVALGGECQSVARGHHSS